MGIYNEIEDILNELKDLDSSNKDTKKEIIRKLAKKIEDGLKERNGRLLNQFRMIGQTEELSSIALYILWLINKYQMDISRTTVQGALEQKYKKETNPVQGVESPIIRLSDNYVLEHKDELVDRIKHLTQGAAKDIRIKTRKDTIDMQGWKSLISLELVELAKKIDEREEIDKELEKEIAERLRMVRDGRFATTWSHYEAIIAAVNCTKSLTFAIEEEKRPLTRDEITKNEGGCKECYCSGSPKNKCDCHCHRTTQAMTTKGLKWAIKHNKRLGEFDEYIKRIGNMEREDICPMIKTLFTNPNMDKHLTPDDKMNLLSKHIEREQCIRCEMFLDKHPDFFGKK